MTSIPETPDHHRKRTIREWTELKHVPPPTPEMQKVMATSDAMRDLHEDLAARPNQHDWGFAAPEGLALPIL